MLADGESSELGKIYLTIKWGWIGYRNSSGESIPGPILTCDVIRVINGPTSAGGGLSTSGAHVRRVLPRDDGWDMEALYRASKYFWSLQYHR
jgi:hypothetical protein